MSLAWIVRQFGDDFPNRLRCFSDVVIIYPYIHIIYIYHYISIFWVGIPKTEYISYVLVLIMGDDLGSEDVPNVRQFVDHLLFDKVHDYYIPTTLRNIINIIKHMKLKSQNIQIYNSKKKLQITRHLLLNSFPGRNLERLSLAIRELIMTVSCVLGGSNSLISSVDGNLKLLHITKQMEHNFLYWKSYFWESGLKTRSQWLVRLKKMRPQWLVLTSNAYSVCMAKKHARTHTYTRIMQTSSNIHIGWSMNPG